MSKSASDYSKDITPGFDDARLDAPAFHRNYEPICQALADHLTVAAGNVLEIGSGTGQHIVGFARAFPHLTWWPTDPNPRHRRSIEAWSRHAGVVNLRDPQTLDAAAPDWSGAIPIIQSKISLSAIICINVLHIAPWAVTEGMMGAGARHLQPAGSLFIYGPFARKGHHTAPSNAEFDASLRARCPHWGVRDTADIEKLARVCGLALSEIVQMPSNNAMLVISKPVDA